MKIINKLENLIERVKYFITLDHNTHLHISDGNSKLGKGVATVNLMPGSAPICVKTCVSNENPTGQLCNVLGTCGGCCENICDNCCYAINGAKYHHNSVIPALAENTLLMRYDLDKFFRELADYLKNNMCFMCRIHSSGEFENYEYFSRFIEFAKEFPQVQFYGYTKRFNMVEQYIRENGEFPNNFVLSMSIWNGNYNNPYGLPEFIYDDGSDPELKNIVHCPAVDKNGNKTGVTCSRCRRCMYAKNGQKTAVYAHR